MWSNNGFKAGDLVVFDIKTIHGAFKNTEAELRVSVDTRWMKKSEFNFL